MTTNYIKYCPVCGGTNIDLTSYGSDGHAQCSDCLTRFTVDAVSIKTSKKLKSEESQVAPQVRAKIKDEAARKETAEEIRQDEKIQTARNLLKKGKFTIDDIAEATELTVDQINEIAVEMTR